MVLMFLSEIGPVPVELLCEMPTENGERMYGVRTLGNDLAPFSAPISKLWILS